MHLYVFILINQNLCVSVPVSPEGLRVISVSPRAFSLHWLSSPGCDKNYMVQLRPDHGNINITTTVDSGIQVHTHTHTHTLSHCSPAAVCQVSGRRVSVSAGRSVWRKVWEQGREWKRERRQLIKSLTVVEWLVCFWSLTYHWLVIGLVSRSPIQQLSLSEGHHAILSASAGYPVCRPL